MKADFSEIVCIIDRSGSMEPVKSDAVGGMNSFITGQKALSGTANFTLVFFNHGYQRVHDAKPLSEVQPVAAADYVPQGMTALLDAVGRTIDEVGNRLAQTPEDQRPQNVVVAILTDGLENSSKDYTRERVAQMIKHQQEKYQWEFLFLAANMDAFSEAHSLNIPQANAQNFAGTGEGQKVAYQSLHERTAKFRSRK
ncbi:MAG: vWA domain-containing protein [Litorilinea sp.]